MGNEEQKKDNKEGLFDYEHQNLIGSSTVHSDVDVLKRLVTLLKQFLFSKKPYIVMLCAIYFWVAIGVFGGEGIIPVIGLIIFFVLLIWSWYILNKEPESKYHGMTLLLLPVTFVLPYVLFNTNSSGLAGVMLVPFLFLMIVAFLYRLINFFNKKIAIIVTVGMIVAFILYGFYGYWRAIQPY